MNNTHQPCSADVAVVTAKLNSHAAPSSGPVSTAQPLKLASNVAPRDAQGVFSLHSGTLIDGTEHAIPLKFTSDVAKNGAEGASTGMQLERTQQHSIHIPPNHNFTPTHIQNTNTVTKQNSNTVTYNNKTMDQQKKKKIKFIFYLYS